MTMQKFYFTWRFLQIEQLQTSLQGGHCQLGSLSANLTSSPYLLRRQTPQKAPRTPWHLPDLQTVFMSRVF